MKPGLAVVPWQGKHFTYCSLSVMNFFFPPTPVSAYDLLLVMHSGIISGGIKGPYAMPGIEYRWAPCFSPILLFIGCEGILVGTWIVFLQCHPACSLEFDSNFATFELVSWVQAFSS